MQARLVSARDLAPEVRHFEFEVIDRQQFRFTPGQFVSLKENVAGREVTRAYSIASPPDGNRFALCLNRVAEGLVSPRLFALQPGHEVEIQEPLGYFTLRHPERPAGSRHLQSDRQFPTAIAKQEVINPIVENDL